MIHFKRALQRSALWFACLAACVLPGISLAEQKPTLEYYYENYCGSCNIPAEFAQTFSQLTGHDVTEYACSYYNIAHSSGRAAWDDAVGRLGIAPDDRRLPMLVLDGEVFLGNDEIQSVLPEAFAEEAKPTEVSYVYLLTIHPCDDCARAKDFIQTLPTDLTLNNGRHSPLKIVEIDLHRETGRALALFQRYQVPETDQIAPSAFLGSHALSGYAAIQSQLEALLVQGEGLTTPIFDSDEASMPNASLSLASSIVAGLVGGLNPCALSMLLLFLSLLIPLRHQPGRYAALFLSGKFVFYLLISTALSGLFSVLRLDWLPRLLKILLTAYCIILAGFNITDAIAAKRGAYGNVRNQLPARMRLKLQSVIRRFMEKPSRLALASLALGALIASGEFLCAGQVYLAVFMQALEGNLAVMLPHLTAYCLAFLTPSIVTAVFVLQFKNHARVSFALYKHMSLIKILTALFFLAIAVITWM